MINYKILTCPCGNKNPVAAGAAGDTITCPACLRQLEVPSLRVLQTLPDYIEPVSNEDTIAPQVTMTTERDRRLGWMLLFALVFLASGAYTAYWGYCYYNSINNDPEYWTMYETWTSWQFLRTGIDTPLTYGEQLWFYSLRDLFRWIMLSGTITAVSLVAILYLWIAPYRRNRTPEIKEPTA